MVTDRCHCKFSKVFPCKGTVVGKIGQIRFQNPTKNAKGNSCFTTHSLNSPAAHQNHSALQDNTAENHFSTNLLFVEKHFRITQLLRNRGKKMNFHSNWSRLPISKVSIEYLSKMSFWNTQLHIYLQLV